MTTSHDGWALIRAQMRHQWKGLLAGVTVGLVWKVKKLPEPVIVAVAAIVGLAVFPGGPLHS